MSVKTIFTLFFYSFLSLSFKATASSADTLITVLEPKESIPAGAVKIKEMVFSGADPAKDCAYFELVRQAKATAAFLGANVVSILNHNQRTQDHPCDVLDVAFYHLPDAHAAEQRFSWRKDRTLTWADFRGPVPGEASGRTAAETSCGMGFETNTVTSKNIPKVYVYNMFQTASSWVRPGLQLPEVLQHEQGHFDLCELYTRKMREEFSRARITVTNLQSVVNQVYESVQREYVARQQQYEQETQHGTIDREQNRWSASLARELSATDSWATAE